jgi:hypothetical protein
MSRVLELTMTCGWVNSVLSRFVVGNLACFELEL